MVFLEFHKIHRKTPVPESIFEAQACNFIKKRLWHRCFPLNVAKFLRTPFLTEHLWATAAETSSVLRDFEFSHK